MSEEQNQGSQTPNNAPQPPSQSPLPPQPPQIEQTDARDLKSAQMLIIAASIAGPVSMIIGGVMLSTVALICGFVAFRRIRVLLGKGGTTGLLAARLRTACFVALAVSALALILNVIALVLVFPAFLEAVQTGDYSKFLAEGSLPNGTGSTGNGSSFWG